MEPLESGRVLRRSCWPADSQTPSLAIARCLILCTWWASLPAAVVRAVARLAGDAMAVSGAAGGVGTITVQLLRSRGAEAIGIALESNHDWLR